MINMDSKKLTEGVHRGLIEVLAAEHPDLGTESDDTRSLARRLVEITMLDGQGKTIPGQFDGELAHRAKLLCYLEVLNEKTRPPRVARAIIAYQRAITAAVDAVMGSEDEK